MKIVKLFCMIFLLFGIWSEAFANDPLFEQRVKYNQSRVKWKIKEGQERVKNRSSSSYSGSSGVSSYGASSSASRNSTSSSSAAARGAQANAARNPSVSASRSLAIFIQAANQATSLDQLLPYCIRPTREHWSRLSPSMKQDTLMNLKKWTYHSTILGEENQPMVATVKLGGQGIVKGVNLWNEGGVWKFSNIIKK